MVNPACQVMFSATSIIWRVLVTDEVAVDRGTFSSCRVRMSRNPAKAAATSENGVGGNMRARWAQRSVQGSSSCLRSSTDVPPQDGFPRSPRSAACACKSGTASNRAAVRDSRRRDKYAVNAWIPPVKTAPTATPIKPTNATSMQEDGTAVRDGSGQQWSSFLRLRSCQRWRRWSASYCANVGASRGLLPNGCVEGYEYPPRPRHLNLCERPLP